MNNNNTYNNTDNSTEFTCWPWQHWAALCPEHIALSVGHQSFSWQALSALVDVHASQLSEQGVKQDHVVAAISANNLDVLCLYLACLRLGACCVVLNPRQSERELQDKLVTLAAQHSWFVDPQTGPLEVLLSEAVRSGIGSQLQFSAANCCLGADWDDSVQWQATRLASLVFTSGSSGTAKAVAHSGDNHLASAAGLLARFSFQQDDSWLLSLPLFHVSGLAIVWRWLAVGARVVLPENNQLMSQLAGVTHASLVPTQLQRFLTELAQNPIPVNNKSQNRNDWNNKKNKLKRVLLGGAVIPVALTERAKQAKIECWLGYGMTETASTITAKLADSSAGVGWVLPNRQLRLQDKQIMVQGAILGLGYYQAGVLRPMRDSAGWLATGDLGAFVDDELFILGRRDNMFISGGENIHPEQIERVLLSHPAITQALVFPCADPEFGQRPVAVIESTVTLDQAELCDYLRGKLAKFLWPVSYYDLPSQLQVSGIKLARSSVLYWLNSVSQSVS